MSVSIIIPTLNEEDYLPILLESLCAQTYRDFEVLVVDGGSKDATGKAAKQFETRLNIKFLSPNLKGVAVQRNFGAKTAKFPYFMFIDADNYIKPEFLTKAVEYMDANKNVDMFTTWVLPSSNNKIYQSIFNTYNRLIMRLMKKIKPVVAAGGFIFVKKPIFEALNGYDSNLKVGEDHDLIERAFAAGYKFEILKSPVVYTSIRRLEKEGLPRFLYVLGKGGVYHFFKGGLTEEVYNNKNNFYNMDQGGAYYNKKKPTKN